MRSIFSLLVLLLVSNLALAVDVEPGGVGAGGWLYSATFAPNSTSTILIGSDMAGVHKSTDSGNSWSTWNEGMPVDTDAQTSYVQGLLSFNYAGTDHYYAATLGGIFHATAASAWSLETPAAAFNYDSALASDTLPIHFSCMDEANGIVVAGAGINRWHPTAGDYIDLNGQATLNDGYCLYATYPSLLDSDLQGSVPAGGQWTVWVKYLNGNGPSTWTPFHLDSGTLGQNEFGAARDIEITQVGGTTYIVVATIDGIYMHNMVPGTDWVDLTTRDAYYPDGSNNLTNFGQLRDMGPGMRAWSVDLTSRGTLYAAMERIGSQVGANTSGGVYRLFDMTDAQTDWVWLGDNDLLPEMASNWDTMRKIGETDNGVYAWAHQIYMSVVEIEQPVAADVVFIGERKNRFGVMRGVQPFQSTVDCTWEALIYGEWNGTLGITEIKTYNPATGLKTNHELGWAQFGWPAVLFKPAVSAEQVTSISDINLIFQGGTRLSITTDGGATWSQNYTQEPSPGAETGPWKSRGYNELAVFKLAYTSDGRQAFASGDNGVFVESAVHDGYYDRVPIVATSASTWADADTKSAHSHSVTTVPDWNGSGEDAVFVLADRNDAWNDGLTKVIMYHNGIVSHATANLDLANLNGGTVSLELSDIVFRDSSTCFVSYRSRNSSGQYDCGFLKGVHAGGSWTWTSLDLGYPGAGQLWRVPRDLMYHTSSGRMFTVCNQGIFVLEADEIDGWIQVFGDGFGEDVYSDVLCLAQSDSGARVYVGTRGSTSRVGTILGCLNPGAGPSELSWTPSFNTSVTPHPFQLQQPFFDSSITNPDEQMAEITSICVEPGFEKRFYFTATFGYFHPKQGLWSYNHSGCFNWNHLTGSNELVGAAFYDIAFDEGDPSQLILASNGLGIYSVDLATVPIVSCDGGGGGGKIPGISLRRSMLDGERGRAVFSFTLPQSAKVVLKIYDVRGRVVRTVDYGHMSAGPQRVAWDGHESQGGRSASGVYFARLSAGGDEAIERFVLLK